MILDLSRRPVLVLHEQCPQSVVVRTFEALDATGRISVKREQGQRRRITDTLHEKTQFIEPGASLKRGNITCHETRLDLYEAIRAYQEANKPHVWFERSEVSSEAGGPSLHVSRMRSEFPKIDLSPEPFEVATAAKDAVTEHLFVWRAAIFIQRRKDLWLVTVRDVSGDKMVDLCTVGVHELDPHPRLKEDFPLRRLMKTVAGKPQNAWEHLLADD